MIKIGNLTFNYNGTARPALEDISLEIKDGEYVLLAGPSGGGKSTLCRCLNGLIPHFYGGKISGRVEVQGLDALRHPTAALAARVGMVFQDPENQLVAAEVEREIAFGLENLGLARSVMAKRVLEALEALGIGGLRRRRVNDLSGGEKQKVAIAAVLALHPEVLVLDEPTSELDPQSAEEVLSAVARLNDELGITIILVEHRLDRVLPHADRLLVLDEGRVIADGPTRDVLKRDYEAVSGAGIGLPPVVRLAREAANAGVSLDGLPLTVKEARAVLEKAVNKIIYQLPEALSSVCGRAMVRAERLWYVYPDGPAALRGLNLEIKKGEFLAVMGRNASGKTTLLKHFNGLLKPSRGTVVVDGMDTGGKTTAELAGKVGFVFQNPNDHLFADTVEDEIGFVLKNRGMSIESVASRTGEVIGEFGLEKYRGKHPRSLSSGEKQRIALASVMAARPEILVLDEPTRGMDYRLKTELMQYLEKYVGQGNTVILVTHDVETVAEHAGRVILMSEGSVVADGPKREVLSRALLFSPQINRLAQSLGRYGVPEDILTVGELLRVLK